MSLTEPLKILHVADLHLSARESERDYSLSVFTDIIRLAHCHKTKLLLIAGDFFDTPSDIEPLLADVRQLAEEFDGRIFYIPGNHEEESKSLSGPVHTFATLDKQDLGKIEVLSSLPWTLLTSEQLNLPVEILAIPHQSDFRVKEDDIPTKRAPWRFAMAHGVLAGHVFQGPGEEGGGLALDPTFFQQSRSDYVALGHIHAGRSFQLGSCHFVYPGSSRVWRRGEEGPRTAVLVTVPDTGKKDLQYERLIIGAAGRYYKINAHIGFHQGLTFTPPAELGAQDQLEVEIHGIVADLEILKSHEEAFNDALPVQPRKIFFNRSHVVVSQKMMTHPLVREFLKQWSTQEPVGTVQEDARDIWLRSRELGLQLIKRRLEMEA